MYYKIISTIIGYFCGCFFTAELVARKYAGKGASELGKTGNPGMANIMASLGFVPGIITLAGDLGKCILAGLVSYGLFTRQDGLSYSMQVWDALWDTISLSGGILKAERAWRLLL